MLPLNCFLRKLLSTRSCYICYSASRKNRVGHFSASILCLGSTSQCTFNLHMFSNIVHQIAKGEHKISHVFSLVLPRTFFLKVDSKKFSLPSDHSIITGEFKIPVFQNYITMTHFIRHWLTICS